MAYPINKLCHNKMMISICIFLHKSLITVLLNYYFVVVVISGYFILPCYLDCQLKDMNKSITRIVPHFHCPICGGNRRRRNAFMHHLEICQGEGMPVAK